MNITLKLLQRAVQWRSHDGINSTHTQEKNPEVIFFLYRFQNRGTVRGSKFFPFRADPMIKEDNILCLLKLKHSHHENTPTMYIILTPLKAHFV